LAGDALTELAPEVFDVLLAVRAERPPERHRLEIVSVRDVHATVVVIDEEPELVDDHGSDLADVVETVQLAGEALQHLEVRDRAYVVSGDCDGLGPLGRILVEDHGLILAARFRGHHRRLSARDELAGVHRMLRSLRDAHRQRELAGRVEGGTRDVVGDPARDREGVTAPARGHDDSEFLTAEPADHVGGAHAASEDVGERCEYLIARAVPVHVIDALEVVDVEHEHADRLLSAARAVELGA
jgi:hypothetical protein